MQSSIKFMLELHYTGKSAEKIKGDLSGEKKSVYCLRRDGFPRSQCIALSRVVAFATREELHKQRGLPPIGSLANMKVTPLGDRNPSPFG